MPFISCNIDESGRNRILINTAQIVTVEPLDELNMTITLTNGEEVTVYEKFFDLSRKIFLTEDEIVTSLGVTLFEELMDVKKSFVDDIKEIIYELEENRLRR